MSSFFESLGKKRSNFLGDAVGQGDRTKAEREVSSFGERLERLILGDENAEKFGPATISNQSDKRNLDRFR